MSVIRVFLPVVLLVFCNQANARMYQWLNPETGTTQFSGKPPAWYRSDDSGPRVFVFESGKLIDDTARELPPAEQDRLRQQAFIRAEKDKEAAKDKLLQAKRLKATLGQRAQREGEGIEEVVEEIVEPEPAEVDQGPSPEDMRALIERWEQLRKENAEKLLK